MRQLESFADAGEEHEREREADCGGAAIDGALEQSEVVLGADQGGSEDRAVGGDQRQIDAQRVVERLGEDLQEDLQDLHQPRDDQDEHDGAQIGYAVGDQQEVVDARGHEARDGHHEDDRAAHAQGGLGGFGDAQEGADAENLGQHEVVDQNATDNQADVGTHSSFPGKIRGMHQAMHSVRSQGCAGTVKRII